MVKLIFDGFSIEVAVKYYILRLYTINDIFFRSFLLTEVKPFDSKLTDRS